jgi:2-phosphoglycerate kinase
MMRNLKVILIGGTSHAGKSTLAESLATKIGWSCCSTDTLARHPGRPWKTSPETVPQHVADHYLSLSVDELIADVCRHYTDIVWPLAEKIIATHTSEQSTDCVIIEGSAILPELAASVLSDKVGAVWITACDELLMQRIRTTSGYIEKMPRERTLIDQFLRRAIAFNHGLKSSIERHGLASIVIDNGSSLEEVSQKCLELCEHHSMRKKCST